MFGIFIAGNPVSQRAGNDSPQGLIPSSTCHNISSSQDPGDSCLALPLRLSGKTPMPTDPEECLRARLPTQRDCPEGQRIDWPRNRISRRLETGVADCRLKRCLSLMPKVVFLHVISTDMTDERIVCDFCTLNATRD